MHTLNLYLLSRTTDEKLFSDLERTLSGRSYSRRFSAHEVASLRAFTDMLERAGSAGELITLLDGFCFSYTIAHISKEFDLLKLAPDKSLVLNVELKSESVSEERIRRQLEQNRYYLSHISRSILSYTYVSETGTLYSLNDHGYFSEASAEELFRQLQRPALQGRLTGELEEHFRASDYLISPAADPDRFLRGEYFLTNQQAQFKQEILELLGRESSPVPPFISLTGSAGTGKTLLLLDIGMELSRKRDVLYIHGGTLREGHRRMDELLRRIRFLDARDPETMRLMEGTPSCSCILCDEANRFPFRLIVQTAETARRLKIPCILAHDPHRLLQNRPDLAHAESLISAYATRQFELSGNIRINQPVYAYLRCMFNRKQSSPQQTDFSCIDILCAADRQEAAVITDNYLENGYTLLALPGAGEQAADHEAIPELVGREYDRVLLQLDDRFYYDEDERLCARRSPGASMSVLYEALTRTREKLCLLVVGNPALFAELLKLRCG